MDLQGKTVYGVLWSVGQELSSKFIGFFITIILARILSPAEFGLIAMLSIFIAVGNSLLDGGLTSSLIRTTEVTQKDCSTVFYFNLIGSILIYGILFLSAPFIARFYEQPVLTNVVRVYGISLIINAFFGIQQTLLVKEMKFKTMTMIQVPSVIGGGMVGIILAKMGYGAWSLVWMSLITSLISTILHWYCSSWRPILLFDSESFKSHFHYGYKLTLSSLIDKLYQNIYTIIIGKFYMPAQLGFYSRADSISQLPIGVISSAINKVTFPMFVNISHDNEQLVYVYRKVMLQVLFWMAPTLIALCVIAEPLFRLMLTDKWLPAVPYFQILCLAGIPYPIHAYNLNILKVKGQTHLFLRLEMIKKVLCVIGILCVFPFGIYGLLYFQLVFTFVGLYINSIYTTKFINYPFVRQIGDIIPTLVISGLVGVVCFFIDKLLVAANFNDLFRIIALGLLYFMGYFTASYLFKLSAIIDFKQLVLKRLYQ
ncbi:lipopolysaccharide biosynthesis protein [Pedobacter gandavensis]|uniref:Oligosaccharide flippase family protein n=1 Tax=Pedobacter gandavensis TaxID=2679963 RepID=A0ABR6ET85_9SPHI|nr:lipopolysaccharide biosynthesis protein [Pedobacter gandavensis]MBB2148475.1 oligosaccharide flippase family protein [Pedobacter gandavensis]